MEIDNDILVVKYGSSCVANDVGLDLARIDGYAEQLAALSEQYKLVVVSSGSIAVGTMLWQQLNGDNDDMPPKQSLATLGSGRAVVGWQEALARRGIMAGQIEVTHREIDEESEGAMLRKTMTANLDHGIVSIVNENDALSDEETKKLSYGGDNDGLASLIARKLAVGSLCLLTDEEGLLDEDNKLVDIVRPRYTYKALSAAGEGTGKWGSGGMRTKVIAASTAAAEGIRAYIANADCSLDDVLHRRRCGTYFAPHR